MQSEKFKIPPQRLPTDTLPTVKQVLQAIFFEKKKNETESSAIRSIAKQLSSLWSTASLPVIQIKSIVDRINKQLSDFKKVAYNNTTRPEYQSNAESFKVKLLFFGLLDIF